MAEDEIPIKHLDGCVRRARSHIRLAGIPSNFTSQSPRGLTIVITEKDRRADACGEENCHIASLETSTSSPPLAITTVHISRPGDHDCRCSASSLGILASTVWMWRVKGVCLCWRSRRMIFRNEQTGCRKRQSGRSTIAGALGRSCTSFLTGSPPNYMWLGDVDLGLKVAAGQAGG